MITELNFATLKQKLPARKADAHKGNFGHVLVVGGAPGFGGAVRLAAEAALHTGAGLVSIATHPTNAHTSNIECPELMCHGVDSENALQALIDQATVILIGPGLGQDAWGRMCWNTAVKSQKPLILDADALNLLAKNPRQNANWILTPHPGEAARLSILHTTEEIQADRVTMLKKLREDYEGVMILKGADTLIADDKNIFVNTYANGAMATAGMGDVLSGIIAGLVAQGLTLIDAATLGVATQTATAEKISSAKNPRVILAAEMLTQLREMLPP